MEYFATLNLDRSASLRDVDRSYKNFARYYHPDKAREFDNPEEFREILDRIYLAHEILSNEILFEVRNYKVVIFLSDDQFCIFFSKLVRDIDLILFL